jgi:hypothetical protein
MLRQSASVSKESVLAIVPGNCRLVFLFRREIRVHPGSYVPAAQAGERIGRHFL